MKIKEDTRNVAIINTNSLSSCHSLGSLCWVPVVSAGSSLSLGCALLCNAAFCTNLG